MNMVSNIKRNYSRIRQAGIYRNTFRMKIKNNSRNVT